ncbi:MAG: DNA alkylation repair protein [Nitrolancea sp.]
MNLDDVISELRAQANDENVAGMARYGINPDQTLGITIPALRAMAKRIGVDHELALGLWSTGIHDARTLAGMIDDPAQVTPEQMDLWASEFDSWDVCDQVCGNLFDRTPFAFSKVHEWSGRDEEFVRRAAFALLAALSVHDKRAPDEAFIACLPLIVADSTDERNFVKKAVNWALRQIGKRNVALNVSAIELAREIQRIDSKAARWIASDALRELTSDKVQQKLERKTGSSAR